MYSQVVLVVEEYKQRLKDREGQVADREQIHIRLGNVRLVLALVAAGIAWESFRRHVLSPWWIVVPLMMFVCIAAYHSRILRARDLARRGASFYRNGLARIADRWAGTGQTGEHLSDPDHVYAADLDLFGRGGLFELLSTGRTRMGEETLAKWLLSPAAIDRIRERHAAIGELRDQLDLREDLAVLGEDASVGVYPEELLGWAEAPNQMKPEWIRWLAPILVIAAAAGAAVWGYWGIVTPLFSIVLIEGLITYRLRKPAREALQGSERALRDLGLLSGILARVEQHSFRAPGLCALQRELSSRQIASSRAIARLRTIVDLSDSRRNVIVSVLDVPLMYSVQVGLAAERWRRAHGHAVRTWLTAVGEIEALLCMATYSHEHPEDPFPEFMEGAACFDAKDIGHPLIPTGDCTRNDVHLSDDKRVFLVSGSNMSGKSTLLRTIGVNGVLAMAGAPVRARRLRLTLLQVGASIRVNDSLQEGSSRFYAEITRLRKLFGLASGHPPLLFLLDELLQGTNSNDRRIGAEGVVRALLNRGAIGLVSTHDLALADIGGSLNGHLYCVHFQEEFENGKMCFDYKLREGVVTKSNGLALMRSIGLDV
ncbi:MAG: mismatch repair protein [Candidatus Sulfotelmatobacter sp.]